MWRGSWGNGGAPGPGGHGGRLSCGAGAGTAVEAEGAPEMMLDSRVLEAPLLDHRGLDLDAAGRVTYVLEQSFRYEYDAPVESLRQRVVVLPRARQGTQYGRAHRLDVHGVQARRSVRRDVNGNVVALLRAERVAEAIEFRLAALLERVRAGRPAPTAGPGRSATAYPSPATLRWKPPSGSATRCTPRSPTSTASPRCRP